MTKTIQEALRWASSLLGPVGADADGARYVLEMRLDWSPSQLQLHAHDALTAAQWTQFEADVARLAKFEPAQYVVGVAPFFGDLFNVTPAVLIPRFDTEELVAWAAAEQQAAATGLDLGTGQRCHRPHAGQAAARRGDDVKRRVAGGLGGGASQRQATESTRNVGGKRHVCRAAGAI